MNQVKKHIGKIDLKKETPFFSIFNLTMTHESCINSKQKHDQNTKDLPNHLRIDNPRKY